MLADYQQTAVQHLLHHERAALFMGVGLGKTLTTLTAFDGLRTLGQANAMLVVAPLRVCNLTWPNELAKWPQFGHLRLANLRTKTGLAAFKARSAQIYVCNYDMLPKVVKLLEDMDQPPFDVIAFDELTRAKNHQSKRINGLRKFLAKVPHIRRWGLTGTPTPNSLLELFAQIRLLDDGKRLGHSFDTFKKAYFHAVDYMEYDWRPNIGAEKTVYGKVADIALTLLSSDYLHIPDTTVEDVEVPLPQEAQDAYDTMQKDLLLAIGDDPDNLIVSPNAGVLVNKLLQIASGSVYNERGEPQVVHTAKVDALKTWLKRNPEGNAIVSYNYRHELAELRKLPGAVAFEDYKTPAKMAALEKLWNEGGIKILLVHPQSVGHGLNLQYGGPTVIWLSPTYSRELYDQLNGRVARRGQTKPTRIVRILCPGTVDDAVVETLRERDIGQKSLLTTLRNLRQMLA